MEPREAGRAPPKKHENDGKGHGKSGSGDDDIQKEEGKGNGGQKDESGSHLKTWVGFLKRSRT